MDKTKTRKQATLKLSDVHQSFRVGKDDVEIIKGISFEIEPQTFNIIFGRSGSGKSTLLNILSGLQKPTTGAVTFEGKEMYDYKPDQLAFLRATQIGIVYQQNYWVKSLNVIENVSMPLYLQGYSRVEADEKSLKALATVNMDGYAKKNPSLLSGGEQQRVAMARAIVNDPSIIIADEPTGSLDSKNGDMIMDLLVKYVYELNRTIILVTHNMEYLTLADHLLKIQNGEVTDMKGHSINETTNAMMKDIKDRIGYFASNKNKGVHHARK